MNFLFSKKLQRLVRLYHLVIAQELPQFNSENYGELIVILYSFNKPLTSKDLTVHLQIDKSRVAVLIDHLIQFEYIYVHVNSKDRREHFVYLTEKGKEIAPVILQAIQRVDILLHEQVEQQQLFSFY